VRARDWLLLLVSEAAPGGLDPVRLQKGMFLLGEEATLPRRERYRFVPYNYGPMSRGLYRGLRDLVRAGLVARRVSPGLPWGRYAITPAGAARAAELETGLGSRARLRLERLREIHARIAGQSFGELLTDVYDRYPEYAARTVFRR
jgi:DNA-binding PadR family transcriptional regulator